METIKLNDSGAAVEDVQHRLSRIGLLDEACIDGLFGTETAKAVASFRSQAHLECGDEVDEKTWAALVDASFCLGDRTLYLRMPHFHGHDVEELQQALGALGFPSGEAVSGKTALTFDISALVPMIAQIYNETSDHKFILKVTDAKGKSTTKTLTCHLTGKVALAYNNDADLWANTATVTAANVPDGGSVQYRVKGAADWTDAVLVEGSKYRLAPVYETSKNAAGLDVHTIKAGTGVFAATTYEVRIAKDG